MNRISQCLFFFMFVSLFLAVLGLRCCAGASHCSGLSCCRAQAPDLLASVVAVRGLTSCSWWTQSCCRAQAPGLLASVVAARGLTGCSWWTQSCCRAQAPGLLASVVAARGLTGCSWWTQSCCRAQAPGLLASVVAARGLTSCSWWTQSLDAEAVPWASLLCNMCSRLRPGTSLVSSALAGGLLLPVPPGKPSVPS